MLQYTVRITRLISVICYLLLIALDVLVRIARIEHGAPRPQAPRRHWGRPPGSPRPVHGARPGHLRQPLYRRRGGGRAGRVPALPPDSGDARALSPALVAVPSSFFVLSEGRLEVGRGRFQERRGLGVVVEESRRVGRSSVKVEAADSVSCVCVCVYFSRIEYHTIYVCGELGGGGGRGRKKKVSFFYFVQQ